MLVTFKWAEARRKHCAKDSWCISTQLLYNAVVIPDRSGITKLKISNV